MAIRICCILHAQVCFCLCAFETTVKKATDACMRAENHSGRFKTTAKKKKKKENKVILQYYPLQYVSNYFYKYFRFIFNTITITIKKHT